MPSPSGGGTRESPRGNSWGSVRGRRPGKTPCVATFHRVFKRVFKDLDVDRFEAVLGEWLSNSEVEPGEALSLDGKTLRGIHGETIPNDTGGVSGVGLCPWERGGAGPGSRAG